MTHLSKHNPLERFSNRAKLYAQARPDYPEEALDYIVSVSGLKEGQRLADIGAGTGISSRAFACRGLKVTAVEPNAAMLEQARSCQEFAERINYVKARAEETGLQAESFDAVLSAQAFHWFEPEKAILEFRRLLKPAGWVILVWNERDESDEFTRSYGDLLRTLPDTSSLEVKRGLAGQAIIETSLFSAQQKRTFSNQQELNLDKFIGRAFSASYSPDPDSPEALEFQNKLVALFEQFQKDGLVVMKYECSVYLAQKPS